ncbi:MAG: hypothetical protein WCT32_03755 [Patescibacteria group bacterium]|jgi:hypothetical protein
MPENKELLQIKQLLDAAESQIRQAKSLLFAAELNKKTKSLNSSGEGSVVEGIFDGETMIGPDHKRYPVPMNYASKSKLVPGDVLKLTINADGSFIFKQIGPVRRKKIIGRLEEAEKGKFVVNADNSIYRVLLASVTYFHAEAGDKLTIVIPEEGESEWAAIENIVDKSI